MYRVSMPKIGVDKSWHDAARGLRSAGIAPADVSWDDETTASGLFDLSTAEVPKARSIQVPRRFVAMADSVVWHSDPARFARLYHFLWRLIDAPNLISDQGDADLTILRRMEKNVHRCQHKMKAFVRFRDIGEPGDQRRSFAAWFEPTHHTVEPTAPFFMRRFGDMDWRIITPDVTATFIGGEISFGEGQPKPALPPDANEQLWTTYFRNIFNPARLKVKAMQSEMPKKYWKNMPEAAAIPELIATASARARDMRRAAPTLPPLRTEKVRRQLSHHNSAWEGPTTALPAAISACTRCPLHANATQAVLGEGPTDAALMIVGEQPGDEEDLRGRPFVGPAGRLFDQLAGEAGLDRNTAYITNAVKHFKFAAKGRRRIHQRPNKGEIEHCKWWLDAERELVRPKVILAMGSTAAFALTGNGKDLLARRGTAQMLDSGERVILTLHPSYVLRLQDGAARATAAAHLVQDLKLAHTTSCGLTGAESKEEK